MSEAVNILVVDDDQGVTDYIVRGLKPKGYNVFPFTDGREALSASHDIHFDLALLDIDMPEFSGFDLGIELRGGGVPIMFISGFNDDKYFAEARAIGTIECLKKPVRLDQLRLSVDNSLDQQRRRLQERKRDGDIREACGMWSVRNDITTDEAYALMHKKARNSNKKFEEIARNIIDGHNHVVQLYRGDSPLLIGENKQRKRIDRRKKKGPY